MKKKMGNWKRKAAMRAQARTKRDNRMKTDHKKTTKRKRDGIAPYIYIYICIDMSADVIVAVRFPPPSNMYISSCCPPGLQVPVFRSMNEKHISTLPATAPLPFRLTQPGPPGELQGPPVVQQ